MEVRLLLMRSVLALWTLGTASGLSRVGSGLPIACAAAPSSARSHPLTCLATLDAGTRFEPLSLPTLSDVELQKLRRGVRVQRQQLIGKLGTGFAVQDVRADADAVWSKVSAFNDYARLIKTVRSVTPYRPSVPVAGTNCYNFVVSRIRLQLNVRFRKDEALRHAAWELERPSWVLADSTGCWHVQPLDARPGYVRVWFCASVKLRARVPAFVQNLVSRLGLQRACGWVATLSNK
jgi:hypothetical protein|tara:strand:- start:380 stop:1084 length:705 start_codon:yes stop_codon:yes gene_type:complete